MTEDVFNELVRKLQRPVSLEEAARRAAVLDADWKRQHAEKVARLRFDWNAPKRKLGNEIKVDGPWGLKLNGVMSRIGTGFLIGLIGERGTGKTQFAVQLMVDVTECERSALYDTATGIFLRFKATFRSEDETEESVVNDYCQPKLLVVDEVGRRADSEWANRLFFEIMDRRYEALKDTILIANQGKEMFLQSLGDALASRMIESGGVVECNWPSFRA